MVKIKKIQNIEKSHIKKIKIIIIKREINIERETEGISIAMTIEIIIINEIIIKMIDLKEKSRSVKKIKKNMNMEKKANLRKNQKLVLKKKNLVLNLQEF